MNKDSTLAFAGMLQASELVRQLATSGTCSQQAASASLSSIFQFSPESTEAVYGGRGGVRMGLRVLVELFGARNQRESMQSLNYTLGLVKLAGKLRQDKQRLEALSREIDLIEPAWSKRGDDFDPSVISQLGDAYSHHISSMDFRLTISGKPEYLKQGEKIALIRALLLAGIRSAILWHQVGGRQWRLLFQRRRMLEQGRELLAS
ncbi:high frequency lysogenization protein HflD [Wenzhouxiangella marina]|uniref:High frequency lysogenization protein HflD homolog n=1 Tax=Wenzhouxiangella marina TaxID=1579979 RepID=A0A0K0XVT6_9GAMM|nr:high frequency lysogenization protein HflD [Wenzhouxiangella marina]AKS41785.1 High frequency lysogenization protein HflD-like protein [Wenzhouxiangella marina]MBB6086453.1 high frequency lysogenization protein [Wenzhouxiangella marina]